MTVNVQVIDDDPSIRQFLTVMLGTHDCVVSDAEDGVTGLAAIARSQPEVVLLDVQMPGMDGFSATLQIRHLEGKPGKVPIIALTAHAMQGDKERCFASGMNEYVTKPISGDELILKIDRLLNIEGSFQEEETGDGNLQDDNQDLFDFNHLDKMSMGNKEFQSELLLTFFEDIIIRYRRLEEWSQNKNLERVINEAHTIKGASSSIGAVKLAEEALAIELSGKHNDIENIIQRLQNMEKLISDTRQIVDEYLLNPS